ncbi:MAG TPA: hypothetical protein VJV23_08175 [Candidatus Polarisedimenticolia bacterium]|nr:hypothetical protein [Candidatus Polarisedimenticolia bacterium]
MRRATQLAAVVAVLAVSFGLAIGRSDDRTLTGTYRWTDGGAEGDLKVIFTPNGDAKWNVAFHFRFSGSAHVYSGSAEGSLSDGALEGRVLNEQKNRSFVFKGTFTGGEFQGTHAETTRGREQATGTLTLKAPPRRAAALRSPGGR